MTPVDHLHSSATSDDARLKLHLHFDNFARHRAGMAVDAMACLRCLRVPHLHYSTDLAICDIYLFGRIKEPLMGVTVVNASDLSLPGDSFSPPTEERVFLFRSWGHVWGASLVKSPSPKRPFTFKRKFKMTIPI
jgi:hypothetical protein